MAAQEPAKDESPEVQALQAVVDRVVSWQESATEGTVREELARGVERAGVEVPDRVLDELARRIHQHPDRVEVGQVVAEHGDEVQPG
jgi:hypothetical protein